MRNAVWTSVLYAFYRSLEQHHDCVMTSLHIYQSLFNEIKILVAAVELCEGRCFSIISYNVSEYWTQGRYSFHLDTLHILFFVLCLYFAVWISQTHSMFINVFRHKINSYAWGSVRRNWFPDLDPGIRQLWRTRQIRIQTRIPPSPRLVTTSAGRSLASGIVNTVGNWIKWSPLAIILPLK